MTSIELIVKPFLDQNEKVYVSIGCKRLYVAIVPPQKCMKCKDVHDVYEISSLADLSKIPS